MLSSDLFRGPGGCAVKFYKIPFYVLRLYDQIRNYNSSGQSIYSRCGAVVLQTYNKIFTQFTTSCVHICYISIDILNLKQLLFTRTIVISNVALWTKNREELGDKSWCVCVCTWVEDIIRPVLSIFLNILKSIASKILLVYNYCIIDCAGLGFDSL